jgi:hypothetical protein
MYPNSADRHDIEKLQNVIATNRIFIRPQHLDSHRIRACQIFWIDNSTFGFGMKHILFVDCKYRHGALKREKNAMKKLALFLMPFFFLAVSIATANAAPDIRGEYSGSYKTVVSNCTDSESNGTYNAILVMNISTQTGNSFSGSATGTFDLDGLTAVEYIQINGTISETGQVSGTTSHTFFATGGEGTFTGQLSGYTLSIENPGLDTYGETCTYIRTISANLLPSRTKLVPEGEEMYFGSPVSISGNFAIVSDNTWHNGSAYIFQRYDSGWNQIARLTADDEGVDNFGASVSIDGDYAIVGAYNDLNDGVGTGSAFIFHRDGNSWNQEAKLLANDGSRGDEFGKSVSICGNYAIVGADFDDGNSGEPNTGSAYIFERSGNNWNQVAKLTASDQGWDDHFGASVSIYGDYVIVGAFRDQDYSLSPNADSGSAYIFERNGSDWNQVVKLIGSDVVEHDWFGYSVSISGEYAVVGAPVNQFYGTGTPAAYIFKRNLGQWNQVSKLVNNLVVPNDFGNCVEISGNYIIVGDWGLGGGVDSVFVFKRSDNSWNPISYLRGTGNFGHSVSISGDYTAIVGAPSDGSGVAYVLTKPGLSLELPDKSNAMPWIPVLLLGD